MNRNDSVQHSFRLNLRNPDHLLVHETLLDLDVEIHRSKSAFITEALVMKIKGEGKDNLTNAGRETARTIDGNVTRRELEEELKKLEGRVTRSVSTQLVGMLLSAIATSRGMPDRGSEEAREDAFAAEADRKGADEALRELSGIWSEEE